MTTSAKYDSFRLGAIAIESSSVNSSGRSRTCLRSTARGMGGPPSARAKMNTVCVGAARAASPCARLTLPATLPEAAASGAFAARS